VRPIGRQRADAFLTARLLLLRVFPRLRRLDWRDQRRQAKPRHPNREPQGRKRERAEKKPKRAEQVEGGGAREPPPCRPLRRDRLFARDIGPPGRRDVALRRIVGRRVPQPPRRATPTLLGAALREDAQRDAAQQIRDHAGRKPDRAEIGGQRVGAGRTDTDDVEPESAELVAKPI